MNSLINIGYIAMVFLVLTHGVEVWGIGTKTLKQMRRIDWLHIACMVPVLTSIILTWVTHTQTLGLFVLWGILLSMPTVLVVALSYVKYTAKVAARMSWWFTSPFEV